MGMVTVGMGTITSYHEQRLLSFHWQIEDNGAYHLELPRSSTSINQVGQELEAQVHESDGTRYLWLWLNLAWLDVLADTEYGVHSAGKLYWLLYWYKLAA